MTDEPDSKTRRQFLAEGVRALGVLAGGGTLGALVARDDTDDMLWQIDPDKCTACGRCATECVLTPSAVKCVHEWPRCGYCELCFGYYVDQRVDDLEAAENRRCPVNAIRRAPVEDPYYEYVIDEPTCIGCGLCVGGCNDYGNGALILQVRHDRCVNCNQCAIAEVCPSDAFVRVPKDQPYLLRTVRKESEADGETGTEAEPEPAPQQPASPPQPWSPRPSLEPAPAPPPADEPGTSQA
ncbi:MAG: 4Fe-4S binding protein [Armatimonadetes bacterium]|nr:4Fe-4S binding protein [Armatimonadota bacterium]